jgi:23S rRNA (cytosine1962-C5)-methyltransferase
MTDLVFFQNRLAKNARRLRKWAARGDIHAYRLYERDIPEFPLIIDWYGCEDGPRVHLQEFDTGWQQTEAEHREWLDYIVEVTAATLELEQDAISVKVRSRQRVKGEKTDQNGPTGKTGVDLVVREGGHRFLVNLEAYQDTGLFLDHRIMRAMIGERARGKRFLNLFSYTGSFTVYAAAAGAVSSDSVDLSNTYLEWASRNLALNKIDPEAHRMIRAEVFNWIRDAAASVATGGKLYDLILLDPPSFSNSKKMMGVLDTQRDHPWLIRQCLDLLAPGGELFFSTNLRSFELDELVQTKARFTEISARTLPEDYRDKKIHRCWLIKR